MLALPRGGVPVGYEVARRLGAPLDLLIVRKLGVPGHEELAMGAIATGGAMVVNGDVVRQLGIEQGVIDRVAAQEREELRRRERAYRGDRPDPQIHGRVVVLVDDGIATGATLRAGAEAIRSQGPARVIAAAPVGPPQSEEVLGEAVDELVCPLRPAWFGGVGAWYEDFSQTSDEEVRELLHRAWSDQGAEAPGAREGDR